MCESWIYMRGSDAFVCVFFFFLPGTFLEGFGLAQVDVPKEKYIVTIKSLSFLKLVVPANSLDPLLWYLLWPSVYSWVGERDTKKGFRNIGARAFLLLGLPLDRPSPRGRLDKSSESKLLNRVSRDTLERRWSLPPPEKESSKNASYSPSHQVRCPVSLREISAWPRTTIKPLSPSGRGGTQEKLPSLAFCFIFFIPSLHKAKCDSSIISVAFLRNSSLLAHKKDSPGFLPLAMEV